MVEYPHECLREILEDTYGVIVYQEQVMQIAQVMAGYSPGARIYRAMGKKKESEMAAKSHLRRRGCNRGAFPCPAPKKLTSWRSLRGGFNKSHPPRTR